ncbi:MAG: hypothetical protein PHV34_13765 [Verrucomicrobiae bacterium]|nr:hypothetical protein [Verrucomicrobiae bacterium]
MTTVSIGVRIVLLTCSAASLWLGIYFLRLFWFTKTQTQDQIFFIAAFAVALGLIIVSFGPLQRRLSVLLSLISLGIGLMGVECALRFIEARTVGKSPDSKQTTSPAPVSAPAAHLWVNGASLCEAPPLPPPPLLPLGSISSTTMLCRYEDGQPALYATDPRGFINPSNIWDSAAFKAILVGDSFTQGFSVPPSDSYATQLRKQLGDVLNLGQAGAGPLMEWAILKEYTSHLRFQKIIWFYFEGNDFLDLKREKNNPFLNRYLTSSAYSQSLLSRQPEINQLLTDYSRSRNGERNAAPAPEKFRVREIIGLRTMRGRLGISFALLDDLKLFESILAQTADYARKNHATFHLVYLPAWERYALKSRSRPRKTEIRFLTTRCGAQFIDIEEVFSRQPNPLSLFHAPVNSHYNQEGHTLVSQTVLRALAGDSK